MTGLWPLSQSEARKSWQLFGGLLYCDCSGSGFAVAGGKISFLSFFLLALTDLKQLLYILSFFANIAELRVA
jgi:hypothetical protein